MASFDWWSRFRACIVAIKNDYCRIHLHCKTDGCFFVLHGTAVAPNSTSEASFAIHENLTCNSLRFMTCHSTFFLFCPSRRRRCYRSFGAALWPTSPHHHVCHNAITYAKLDGKKIYWRDSLECVKRSKMKCETETVSWSDAVVPRSYQCDERVTEWARVFDVKLLWCIVSLGPLNVLLAFKLCYCCCWAWAW